MAQEKDKDLPKMIATNVSLVLCEAAIKWAKTWDKPYKELTELDQRTFISSFNATVGQQINNAVDLIVADKRVAVKAVVDQVVFKDGCKIVLKAAAVQGAFDLAECTGHTVSVIVTGSEKYTSESAPKPDKDQKKLALEAANKTAEGGGAGVRKDSRTKRSGKKS